MIKTDKEFVDLKAVVFQKHGMDEILMKRKRISELLKANSKNIKSDKITKITAADIELLFQLYNDIFYDNLLSSFTGKFKFSLSRRMTKSAGMTICPKYSTNIITSEMVIEIRIGIDFIFHYDQLEGNKEVGGCQTHNSLEALQLVFEHELCHAVEFILFHKSNCKMQQFKTICANLFGHTESHHQLPTYSKIAEQRLNLKVGDQVVFEFEGKCLEGLLYKINKRAIVMVKDAKGNMADKQGNRYSKYYVPLQRLTANQ